MQTFVVEARRFEGGPWLPVTTVQEDLVDDVAQIVADGPMPGDWRIRELDERPHRAVAPTLPRPSRWERVRWWALMRFSPKGRRLS